MDRVLVVVDLGEHGVEMHERAAVGISKASTVRIFASGSEEIQGRGLDGVGGGALGDTDRESVLGEVENVTALDVGVAVAVVVTLDKTFKVGGGNGRM